MKISESLVLCSTPTPCIETLKDFFSLGSTSVDALSKRQGKSTGSISNILHDLKILGIITQEDKRYSINPDQEDIVRDIIYGRKELDHMRKLFMEINGAEKAIEELGELDDINALNIGKIFAYHKKAKAAKESSWKQIGVIYLRWLNYLGIVNKNDEGNNILIKKTEEGIENE